MVTGQGQGYLLVRVRVRVRVRVTGLELPKKLESLQQKARESIAAGQ